LTTPFGLVYHPAGDDELGPVVDDLLFDETVAIRKYTTHLDVVPTQVRIYRLYSWDTANEQEEFSVKIHFFNRLQRFPQMMVVKGG